MIGTGLEFAPGTTEDCKKKVGRLVTPTDLLGAYRAARTAFGTSDLVLRISEQDPSGFEAEPRATYIKRIRELRGKLPFLMRGIERSAHAVVQLPFEDEAMWLVVVAGPKDMPVMCVVFATPYEVAAAAN